MISISMFLARYYEWQGKRMKKALIQRTGGVPSTLEEAFSALDKLTKPEDREQFKNGPDTASSWHFGLGMWMRNNWGLWEGGPLKEWFATQGIVHADDMSAIIMKSWHRHLNSKPLDLDSQIQHFRQDWIKIVIDPDTMERSKDA